MGKHKIKKGLDLPITGAPEQNISEANKVSKIAIIGDDYVGMKPTMLVKVGDNVKLGQILFTDKKMEGINFTSPGAGKVVEINRGEKRHFQSIVIQLEGHEEETFKSFTDAEIKTIDKETVKTQLLTSGQWQSLKSRPFSKVADPATVPHSIFVTAMDSNPLAPSIEKVLEGSENDFQTGLFLLTKLTDGKIFICKSTGSNIPVIDSNQISVEEFEGPHPSGNVGTHIHFVDPVGRKKSVWYINAQDLAAVGYLFKTGRIKTERIVSLAGPSVKNPKLLKTRLGACLSELTNGELKDGENRIISGSVLSGVKAEGAYCYLGKFHQQVSVVPEGREKKFLGWLTPGFDLFSVKRILASSLTPNKKFNFNTSTNGGERAIVPIGSYEQVMPLDILPTYLLRSLAVNDVEEAEKLGVLELDEEDLALCTYVCPSKLDHGHALRRNLTLIEKEG
ncbi:MAG: Na(+)-translocating NADH-quinone reductase subunit A [Bacteroidetes bacterium]|nr:Na(+)-translocating NADH-quinone reductase subunit A [Bacteroidota bacterium]